MKENKSDSKINWWVIIAVAIVVAVISSLITVSVTGNVIKQNNYIYGKYQLYTKQEVDSKLAELKGSIPIKYIIDSINYNASSLSKVIKVAGYNNRFYGDVNEDGKIDISDVVKVQIYVSGNLTFNNYQKIRADVNMDGYINQRDSELIMGYIVGNVPYLPII